MTSPIIVIKKKKTASDKSLKRHLLRFSRANFTKFAFESQKKGRIFIDLAIQGRH